MRCCKSFKIMKTKNQVEIDITKLIEKKQTIFEKINNRKNRTTDKVEYYGKKLRTIQAKIDVLTDVING